MKKGPIRGYTGKAGVGSGLRGLHGLNLALSTMKALREIVEKSILDTTGEHGKIEVTS